MSSRGLAAEQDLDFLMTCMISSLVTSLVSNATVGDGGEDSQ